MLFLNVWLYTYKTVNNLISPSTFLRYKAVKTENFAVSGKQSAENYRTWMNNNFLDQNFLEISLTNNQ